MNWEAGWKKEKHFLEILSNESARRLQPICYSLRVFLLVLILL